MFSSMINAQISAAKCNNTKCKKLQSVDRRANSIIKPTVTSIGSCLNCDICLLVKRYLLNEFNLDT